MAPCVRALACARDPHGHTGNAQTLLALEYMHFTNNQIHRDLKSDNVLFNQAGQIKLGDFGSTAKLSRFSERRTTVVGVRAPPPFTRRGVVLHLDPGANSRSS